MNFFNKIEKPYFLAEIGVNHNGSLKKAKKLILSAKESGANGVKFQTFSAKNLAEKIDLAINLLNLETRPPSSSTKIG